MTYFHTSFVGTIWADVVSHPLLNINQIAGQEHNKALSHTFYFCFPREFTRGSSYRQLIRPSRPCSGPPSCLFNCYIWSQAFFRVVWWAELEWSLNCAYCDSVLDSVTFYMFIKPMDWIRVVWLGMAWRPLSVFLWHSMLISTVTSTDWILRHEDPTTVSETMLLVLRGLSNLRVEAPTSGFTCLQWSLTFFWLGRKALQWALSDQWMPADQMLYWGRLEGHVQRKREEDAAVRIPRKTGRWGAGLRIDKWFFNWHPGRWSLVPLIMVLGFSLETRELKNGKWSGIYEAPFRSSGSSNGCFITWDTWSQLIKPHLEMLLVKPTKNIYTDHDFSLKLRGWKNAPLQSQSLQLRS